jgi:hypothetical protein
MSKTDPSQAQEDEYTSALSTIIARDFFPSLERLDATNTYLSALESRDVDQIDTTARRLSNLATPSNHWRGTTPRGGPSTDTPIRTPGRVAKKPKYDTCLSLDEFQAKYTSEDNASFTEILDEENRKRKEKWGWAWEAEKRANDSKKKEVEGRRTLLIEAQTLVEESARRIEAAEQRKAIEDVPGGDTEDINESDEDEAAVELAMLVRDSPPPGSQKPPDQQQIDVMAPLKDPRSATVPGWSFKVSPGLSRLDLILTPLFSRTGMPLCLPQMPMFHLTILLHRLPPTLSRNLHAVTPRPSITQARGSLSQWTKPSRIMSHQAQAVAISRRQLQGRRTTHASTSQMYKVSASFLLCLPRRRHNLALTR